MNTALLVIDMQTGLLNRNVYRKQELIESVNSLLNFFHSQNMPVILIRHTNKGFSQINTDDWQVDSRIKQTGTEVIIDKSHSSIFKETSFIKLITEMKITKIAICGLVSNGCVQAACIDGVKHGFTVYLVDGAHSTWHKEAEQVIADWTLRLKDGNVKIISLKDVETIAVS